eukprot:356888-Chlamydomonas_euryale.AAC.1
MCAAGGGSSGATHVASTAVAAAAGWRMRPIGGARPCCALRHKLRRVRADAAPRGRLHRRRRRQRRAAQRQMRGLGIPNGRRSVGGMQTEPLRACASHAASRPRRSAERCRDRCRLRCRSRQTHLLRRRTREFAALFRARLFTVADVRRRVFVFRLATRPGAAWLPARHARATELNRPRRQRSRERSEGAGRRTCAACCTCASANSSNVCADAHLRRGRGVKNAARSGSRGNDRSDTSVVWVPKENSAPCPRSRLVQPIRINADRTPKNAPHGVPLLSTRPAFSRASTPHRCLLPLLLAPAPPLAAPCGCGAGSLKTAATAECSRAVRALIRARMTRAGHREVRDDAWSAAYEVQIKVAAHRERRDRWSAQRRRCVAWIAGLGGAESSMAPGLWP